MKTIIKTTALVIVIFTIVIYSKSIHHEIIESYKHYIEYMASNVQIPYSS